MNLPQSPRLGHWIGFTILASIALVCLLYRHTIAAEILFLLGVASLLTPVSYWQFDKARNRMLEKSSNGLFVCRRGASYPLNKITSVLIQTTADCDCQKDHVVYVAFEDGKRVCISSHRADAARVAAFLAIETTAVES